jgi:hypothetical protein
LIGKDVQFGAAGQFKTYDWPLPRAPIYPGPLRTWTLNAQTQLVGKDTFFDGPGKAPTYEWLIRLAPRFIQGSTQGRVTGPDKFFAAPGEAPVYDWPTPKSAVTPGKTWTYSLNQTTLAPVIQANPFFQTDWPLPRTIPYQNSLRTALDWFTFVDQDTFFGGSGQPPANMDWPLPKMATASGETWLYTLNQTTLAPTLQAPFSQSDWLIPKVALYPAQNRTWLDQVKLNLIGLDQFFGAQGQGPTYDWPTPRTAVRLQDYSWANNLSQSTLAPFIAPMPFNLYDWPLTRSTAPLVDLHSLIQGSGFPDQIPPPVVVEIVVPPIGGGASGAKRYRQPAWWGDEKKRKLLKKVEAVQLQIEKKREQVDFAPDLFRMQRLLEQIAELQKRMMKLLEQIDELNKIAGEEEVLLIYTIYRSLH